MNSTRSRVVALAIVLLGFFLRFANLETQLYSHDEAYTSLNAAGFRGGEAFEGIWGSGLMSRDDIQVFLKPSGQKDVFDTLGALRSHPQESPLYFLVAHYWMRFIGSSPAAMRALSVFIGLLAIPGMYWLCLKLFGSQTTAILSALLVTLSPFHIAFAQDARPYSLWAVATVFSSGLFLRATRDNKKSSWSGYALSLGIGFYIHQLFVLIAIAHGCYLVTLRELRTENRLPRYIASSCLGLLMFAPWLYQILTHWTRVTSTMDWANMYIPWWQYIQRWILILASPFIDLQFGPRSIIPYLLRGPMLLLLAYALYFLIRSTHRRVWVFIMLLIGLASLPFIASDVLLGRIVSIQGRYFVPANLASIPAVAHLLTRKLSMTRTTSLAKWRIVTAVVLGAQVGSALNMMTAETWWSKNLSPNSPEIVRVLNEASNPLFVVYGMAPTDLGDVLALSLMVDGDVRFKLIEGSEVVDLPAGFSDIYWYHQTYTHLAQSENGGRFTAREVVPYRLWRIQDNSE